jgi:hypothetical protein
MCASDRGIRERGVRAGARSCPGVGCAGRRAGGGGGCRRWTGRGEGRRTVALLFSVQCTLFYFYFFLLFVFLFFSFYFSFFFHFHFQLPTSVRGNPQRKVRRKTCT